MMIYPLREVVDFRGVVSALFSDIKIRTVQKRIYLQETAHGSVLMLQVADCAKVR